jgi:hypothetical protein
MGTCDRDANEEATSGDPTRARVRMRGGRGGTARSSDEVPHKGMEPRRCVKDPTRRVNQQWEELTGLGRDVILLGRDDILNLMGAV